MIFLKGRAHKIVQHASLSCLTSCLTKHGKTFVFGELCSLCFPLPRYSTEFFKYCLREYNHHLYPARGTTCGHFGVQHQMRPGEATSLRPSQANVYHVAWDATTAGGHIGATGVYPSQSVARDKKDEPGTTDLFGRLVKCCLWGVFQGQHFVRGHFRCHFIMSKACALCIQMVICQVRMTSFMLMLLIS